MAGFTSDAGGRDEASIVDRSGMTRSAWGVPHVRTGSGEVPSGESDVIVVGAGIAGLTTAYLLAASGKSVTVIDEKPVGGGETGRTSAHLASIVDDRFSHVEKTLGLEAARVCYMSHAAAIDLIERIDREEGLRSDFARLDAYLFETDGKDSKRLHEERDAAARAGVPGAEWLSTPGRSGLPEAPCIRFQNQARFQPLTYLNGLASVLDARGVRFVFGRRVKDLSGSGPVRAQLDEGTALTAQAGVAATNVPAPIANWMGVYLKQAAYRTYIVGFRMPQDTMPDVLVWDFADPYHYVRLHRDAHGPILLVGGEDHRTGQPPSDPEQPFRKLTEWTRLWFPAVREEVCRWSGQVNEPDDGVAFIGRVPTKEHDACHVITGDSGMGLTHGTLGAMLVSDQILGRSNPWEELYSPARKPMHNAGTFASENAAAVAPYIDALKPGDKESDIAPGEGGVVRRGLHLLAEHRDQTGRLHSCSAVCTHLKGIVRWNAVEKTWDCPVHGSRFGPCGRVVTGPAVDDLPREDAARSAS